MRLGSLENRWPSQGGSWVRIPPPPLCSADSAVLCGIAGGATPLRSVPLLPVNTAQDRLGWATAIANRSHQASLRCPEERLWCLGVLLRGSLPPFHHAVALPKQAIPRRNQPARLLHFSGGQQLTQALPMAL